MAVPWSTSLSALPAQEVSAAEGEVFAAALSRPATSPHGLTAASHHLPSPPAQLPGSTNRPAGDLWVCKGALHAMSFMVEATELSHRLPPIPRPTLTI